MALELLSEPEGSPAREVMAPALLGLPARLLQNAGHTDEEAQEVVTRLMTDPSLVYDAEASRFGTAEEAGVFDAAKAVERAVENALSIAGVLGTMGGIVAQYRDHQLEREEAAEEREFARAATRAHEYVNEADIRA
jgi:chaperonin GroEL (HSP60 family)